MGDATHRGPYAYGLAAPPSGVVGFAAKLADGTGSSLALPAWQQVDVGTVIGAAAHADVELLVLDKDARFYWEVRAEAKHNYGQYVVLGVEKNAEPLIEVGRIQCNSNDFVFGISPRRLSEPFVAGDTLTFYVSSTFQWIDFELRNIEILGIEA